MISDATLAQYCMALYDYSWWDDAHVLWDHVEQPSEDDGVMWALKRTDGFDVITFRGSSTVHDWFYNFIAFAVPIGHGPLGPMHPGFREGCPEAWEAIKAVAKQPLVFTGHSLGGAHAAIIAGMASLEGRSPVRRVTFGEPRPGFKRLAAVTSNISSTLYLNGWDLIPGLPVRLQPMENYVHDRQMTKINVTPHGHALEFGPFGWHHMMLYDEYLNKGDDHG